MYAKDYILLLTFFFELFTGIGLIYLAIVVLPKKSSSLKSDDDIELSTSLPSSPSDRMVSSSSSSSSPSHRSKRSARFLDEDKQEYDTSKLQLLLMGVVNVFSSVCCYLKFTIDTAGGNSSAVTYLQWGVCTPPIIIVICLVCTIDHETTMVLAFMQAITILCGYIGSTENRPVFIFTWFTLGAIVFVSLFSVLLIVQYNIFRRNIENSKENPEFHKAVLREHKLSKRLLVLTIVTWSIYPIIWAVEQSGNASNASVTIAHSCLAFFAKMSFGAVLGWYRTHLGYESASIVSFISSSVSTSLPSPVSKILRRGTIDDVELQEKQQKQHQHISIREDARIAHPNSLPSLNYEEKILVVS